MADILFTLDAGIDDAARDRLLASIEALPGIARAAPIKRDAANPAFRRMHFARLSGDAPADACLAALREMPGIEQASLPARRGPA